MNRWHRTSVLVLLCVLAAGCAKKVSDQEAVRASIDKHLNARTDLNMSAMDREVKQVTVNGDNASAQVEFRVKGGDARMEIVYTLQRQGKDWNVLSGQPVGMGDTHGGMPQSPAGGPDSGAGGGQMPSGHPPAN